jgi:hypothetical protein
MRTSRRRIEVNLEELDQIIDRATNAPLSKADSEKLKAVLHAMAERCSPNRSTEKTRSVLKESPVPASAQEIANTLSRPAGHGRRSAAEFTSASKVAVPHTTLKHGVSCPACHTCELNSVNPFDYLTELLRHAEALKQQPSEWMPWNYRETLARSTTPTAA